MTYTELDDKVLALCNLAIEMAADDDESIDKREASKMEYQRGSEVVGVAWLSGYDSRGDAPPCLQKVIDSLYDAQAAEWARQYPERGSLFDAYESEDESIVNEAEEWLSAALEGEAAFLQIEITFDQGNFDNDSIQWWAAFTNEINNPLGPCGRGEMDAETFLALDDDAMEKLAKEIAESAYNYGK